MRFIYTLTFLVIANICPGQYSSLLWEISGNHLKKPSYLFGTMHVKDKRVFRFGDSVMFKFNECKVFAGELNMRKLGLGEVLKLCLMPKDTSLSMLLNKNDYDLVKKAAEKKLGKRAIIVDRMKPIFSSALFVEEGMEKDSSETLDEYFQNYARKRKMKVTGLETAAEQMAALDQLSLEEQAQVLLETIKGELENEEGVDELMQYYISEDLDGLLKFMNDYPQPENFNQSVLIKRNFVMADRIPAIIKKNPTFIGIGAAHLPGKEGVIELLRNKGYQVRPVVSKFSGNIIHGEDTVTLDNRSKEKWMGLPILSEDKNGWVLLQSEEKYFQVLFPSFPKVEFNEAIENDTESISAFGLEPGTDNLFSLVYYPNYKPDSLIEKSCDDLLQTFLQTGRKVIQSKKSMNNELQVLEVELMEAGVYIRMKYYFLKDFLVEMAVTADPQEVRSKNSEYFFDSFKIVK